MRTEFQNVEAVSTINYQFTAIPTNLFLLLDNNCRSTLFSLIQLSTYYAKEDGYFYRTNSDLEFETNLSKNVINASLDALYINGIIDVVPSAKGKGKKQSGKHFKVNFEKFLEYESISIDDAMKNEELKIYTPNYKGTYTPSFNNDTKCNTTLVTSLVPTLVTTLVKSDNNINNIENKDNKNNINKKENNINIFTSNILEENSEEIEVIETSISDNDKEENNLNIKEVGFVDNPTSDKIEEKEIENNNTFQLCEVGMLEKEETKTTSTMTDKFRNNLNILLDKLNLCTSIQELEEKVIKLCNWVESCNMSYTTDELDSIKENIASTYSLVQDKLIEEQHTVEETSNNDFFNNIECDPYTAKTIAQTKKEEIEQQQSHSKSKEQFIADLEEYKNTIIKQDNLEDAQQQFKMYCNLKDKQIREYELIPMVADIIKELNTQINANKTFLTTFNLQDKNSITEVNKTQENALNALKSISYVVDDSEDYPF